MRSRFTLMLLFCFMAPVGCGGDDGDTSGPTTDAGTDSGRSGASGSGGGSGGTAGTGGGTGGSGGTGATGGSSGAAGSSGSSGSGGIAGSAGSAGVGGASGEGGSGGAEPACLNGSDCAGQVCDPATLTCMESTCDPDDYTTCPGYPATICLAQDNGQGACYLDCVPFDGSGSCGLGAQCQVQSDDESIGLCYYTGSKGAGETCTPTDTGTDCMAGTVCVNFGSSGQPDRHCSTVCRVFEDGPTGCLPGELCMVPAICLPAGLGVFDDVPVGAECTEGDYLYCGNVSGRLTGICDDAPSGGAELRCYAWCRLAEGNEDCDAGFTCTDTDWGNGLGVCVGE